MTIDWPSHEWPTICPFCGQHHEAVSHSEKLDILPNDGNVSFCFGCGAFCIFDETAYGGMRKPTKKEHRVIARDERLQQMLAAWKFVKRQ